ncbi:hypothetical protein L204_102555 [Cryptococcus depauperatus]
MSFLPPQMPGGFASDIPEGVDVPQHGLADGQALDAPSVGGMQPLQEGREESSSFAPEIRQQPLSPQVQPPLPHGVYREQTWPRSNIHDTYAPYEGAPPQPPIRHHPVERSYQKPARAYRERVEKPPQIQVMHQQQDVSSSSKMADQMQMMMMNQMMMQQMQSQQMQAAQMAAMTQQTMQNMQSGNQNINSNNHIQNNPVLKRRKPKSSINIQTPAPPTVPSVESVESLALDNWQEATIILCFAAIGLIYLICSRASGSDETKKPSLAKKHMS